MKDKALSVIERYQMLTNGATVVVALSGGADSIALVSFLNSIKEDYNIKIIAAHINHGIRGEEAEKDEEFVKDYCHREKIELKILRTSIPDISKQTGESEEECGRRIRYEFFESIDKNAVIATAHTKSDNAETVVFNLTRGATLKGLCGIPEKRGKTIRPLIECSRADIEKYCLENGLSFVTDSTNNQTIYSRNRIRHNVIPELEKINPAFCDAVYRCTSSLKEDQNLLNSLAENTIQKAQINDGYDAVLIRKEHIAIRKRVIANLIFKNCKIYPQQKHIDMVDNILFLQGQIQICENCYIRVKNDVIDFPNYNKKTFFWSVPFDDKNVNTPCGTIKTRLFCDFDYKTIKKNDKDVLDNFVDYDKMIGCCIFRNRKQGDKFTPRGRNVTKSLKKLFNEAKIPVEKRNDIIILSSDDEIFWIEGFGASESVAVTENTKNILEITIGR